MSYRSEQLESTLHREIGQIIAAGLSDPRVRGLITVTKVELTPDKRQATVGISVMPEKASQLTLDGLRSAARHIQTQVSRRIRVRHMPHLRFVLDPSVKKEAEVLRAIGEAMRETEPAEADRDAPSPESSSKPSSSSTHPPDEGTDRREERE